MWSVSIFSIFSILCLVVLITVWNVSAGNKNSVKNKSTRKTGTFCDSDSSDSWFGGDD